MPSKNPQEENSALEAYFQCDRDNLMLRSKLDMIGQICDEPCFNTLRTKVRIAQQHVIIYVVCLGAIGVSRLQSVLFDIWRVRILCFRCIRAFSSEPSRSES